MGWPTFPLESLCKEFTDGNWIESKDQSAEGIRLIQTGNVGEGAFKDRGDKGRYISEPTFNKLKCFEIFEGDCLISRLPDPVGRSCVLPDTGERMITAVDCTVVRFDTARILPQYFNFYSQSSTYLSAVDSLTSGATRKRISRKNLGRVEIPIPSISEQKRIVAILDQAFADIDKARALTEQNLKNAHELFESYLQQVFSRRGEGWANKSLGEIGKVSMCKRILKSQTSTSGDIPFFKIGTFGKTPDAFIDRKTYEEFKSKYSFPKEGDVLISASGTIGRRVAYDGKPAYFQDSNIVWIDNDENMVLNEYLYQFYGVCDWNPSKGATISRLYNDDLRSIKISFPSLEQQKSLVCMMVDLNKKTQSLQSQYIRKLADLDELKKSLLQKAFSGELSKGDKAAA
ncbi:MAG: hypothetical protein CVV07_12135 [Gammaproteobacteria bacterium HGW-Gammaproteobacteria-11]|nr:MAG: hypothetical protein CVV07_12135 [Gammaproteobacteria bacterium HGW-Gammaproteobacteria-11]